MQDCSAKPTSYPEINSVLSQLLINVRSVLGKRFIGLYIYGSLASGDFNPQRSDIDFLVVTTEKLPQPIVSDLKAMHTRISSSGLKWATKLEGSYIPQHALRRYDPAHAHHPSLRVDGSFDIDHHGKDWIILGHLIREQAIILAGPDPEELIDPIPSEDLHRAARATLEGWWAPQIQNPTRLDSSEYQAYTVLTMCRIQYTLHHGTVVSKSVAVEWAIANLDKKWTSIIEGARAWPQNSEFLDMRSVQAFIQHTVERAETMEKFPNDE